MNCYSYLDEIMHKRVS